MSVILICGANDAGAVECSNYPGVFVKEVFKGCVVGLRERNMHDDSDFFARVWNYQTGRPEEVMYGTTRGWTYAASAEIDATPEVRALVAAWDAAQEAQRLAALAEVRAAYASVDAQVKILKAAGRRSHRKGEIARITWVGPNQFKRGEYQARVEFADGEREYFPLSSLQVCDQSITCEEARVKMVDLI